MKGSGKVEDPLIIDSGCDVEYETTKQHCADLNSISDLRPYFKDET